jgi:hypothetical protein
MRTDGLSVGRTIIDLILLVAFVQYGWFRQWAETQEKASPTISQCCHVLVKNIDGDGPGLVPAKPAPALQNR